MLRRILHTSSHSGDWMLDFLAGSGTTDAVAQQLSRCFLLVDDSSDTLQVMQQRLSPYAW